MDRQRSGGLVGDHGHASANLTRIAPTRPTVVAGTAPFPSLQVNVLNLEMFKTFDAILQRLNSDAAIKAAVVISGEH